MNIVASVYKGILEGILFLITIIVLFTLFADFGQKVGLLAQTLESAQMQYLGFVSSGLAVVNILSNKFFELPLLHA